MHHQFKPSKHAKCSFLPLTDNDQEHVLGAGQDPSAQQILKVSYLIALLMGRGKSLSNSTRNDILYTL